MAARRGQLVPERLPQLDVTVGPYRRDLPPAAPQLIVGQWPTSQRSSADGKSVLRRLRKVTRHAMLASNKPPRPHEASAFDHLACVETHVAAVN
jgi:hypothetical protein